MRNLISILAGSALIIAALGCGLIEDLGIVVVVDDINMTMVPKTSVADIQNGAFAVANYEMSVGASEITEANDLQKPADDKQILITFAVDKNASGNDAERGKYTPENIKWFHVYSFKDGNVQKKVLKDFTGSVLLPKFKTNETEIPGAVDIRAGNDQLKGAFFAKKLNQ